MHRSLYDPTTRTPYFFFFQAEDGIRDRNVTGVQTCALPISRSSTRIRAEERVLMANPEYRTAMRSEERRVGKECRSRWARCHEKEKGKDKRHRNEQQKEGVISGLFRGAGVLIV